MLIEDIGEKYRQEVENIKKNGDIIEEKLNEQLLAYHFLVEHFLKVIETSSWENWFKEYALISIDFYKEDNYDGDEVKIINKICDYLKKGKQQKIQIFMMLFDIMLPLENTIKNFKLINEYGDIFCPGCDTLDDFDYMESCYLCGSKNKKDKINIITVIETLFKNEFQILKNININKIHDGIEEFLNQKSYEF